MHPDKRSNRTTSRGITATRTLGLGLMLVVLFLAIRWVITPPLKRNSKPALARSLLVQIGNAIESYADDNGAYPPDWIPANARLLELTHHAPMAGHYFTPDPPVQCSAEALCYYLRNPNIAPTAPYIGPNADVRTTDLNGNGIPEFSDPWGRPILYDRRPFATNRGYDCPDSSGPRHTPDSYDLYIIRPRGMFGSIRVTEPGKDTLRRFNAEAMKTYGAADHPDVIRNWYRDW